MIEVLLPDIGDFHDVEVIEILVNPGDSVEAKRVEILSRCLALNPEERFADMLRQRPSPPCAMDR